ncbi:hypothetical protein TrRE_jg10442 [Triparma retinervis]|uniref:EF-hand domain-containing protein n=1 Tax=Triparma retinervis TaxID=2557542 RepID=A0A9W6ZQF8_9STRA|nr:hypothetical protein TrRE_jg10442 [Triparma retinervis]
MALICFDQRTRRASPGTKLLFKSAALVGLVGAYAVYNAYSQSPVDAAVDGEAGRRLGIFIEGSAGAAVIIYILGVVWMFVGLAIVCDEFFVPALEVISDRLNLTNDIAGATLMAAGGSAPELFTSLVGTFQESEVGFGTIVGSAVFNVMFVIGVCAIASSSVLSLNWWPLARDCTYYATVLIILAGFMSDEKIAWWEATILFLLYFGYVLLMAYNVHLYKWILVNVLKKDSVSVALAMQEVSDVESVSINKPTGFRAGLYSFMNGKTASLANTAGTSIVAQIAGNVEETFKKIDTDNSGTIEIGELGDLLSEVSGDKVSPEEVDIVMKEIDEDKSGGISFPEFTAWYLKSEQRLTHDVQEAFHHFDVDKSGSLCDKEIAKALCQLNGVGPDDEEIKQAVKDITQNDSSKHVSFQDFSSYYMGSHLKELKDAQNAEQSESSEGLSLAFPTGSSPLNMFNWLFSFPLAALMKYTIPDVRVVGLAKYCYVSFLMSIIWIGIFSYFMVGWATIIGNTFGIPIFIMGLTFLAAGTSVPDLLSSVIVAKQGHGDMAVSSSIGSNIFDVLVGLPFPWLCYSIYYTIKDGKERVVSVGADGVVVSIGILVGMLLIVVGSVHWNGWKMTKKMGYFYFFMYFVFVVQELIKEYA